MTIQKRIHELDIFEPEDITNVWLAVDNPAWTEPRKMTLEGFFGDTHIEAAKLSSLASKSVSVVFGTPFVATVVELSFKCYRLTTIAGNPVQKNVKVHSVSVSLTGFSLTIDDSEDLTGVIINYAFIEQ